MVQGTFILFFTSPKTDGTVHRIKNLAFFFYNNDYTQSKNNLKDIQQSSEYNILYNQGKIKMLK